MSRFLDSEQKPTPGQIDEIKGQLPDVFGWAANVCGDGVAPSALWTPDDIHVVLSKGLEFLPIASPDYAVDQTARSLVAELLSVCQEVGIWGAGAIDTEYQERGNPHVVPTVDGWGNHLRDEHCAPNVYGGAGYFGNCHQWVPAWTARAGELGPMPALPPLGCARQYAGNISIAGVLVDVSISNGLPFACGCPRP